MKIVITGKNGQVGSDLFSSLSGIGEVFALNREDCDLNSLDQINRKIDQYKPDIIINAAAYTNVDRAEAEPELAFSINAHAPEILAKKSSELNIPIIHFSTDYIFDGLKEGSYSENDKASPLSIYGKSKWLGEEAVRQFNPKHLILRTSWVFSKNGRNFLRTIMRLSQEKDKLNVVNDQIGAPTSVSVISAAVLKMIISINENKNLYGTYHLTCSGETTWYKYSKEIINYLNSLGITTKLTYDSLLPMINLGQDTLRAERPLNSRLNTEKIKKTFNLELPFWKDEVERVIREIVNK